MRHIHLKKKIWGTKKGCFKKIRVVGELVSSNFPIKTRVDSGGVQPFNFVQNE